MSIETAKIILVCIFGVTGIFSVAAGIAGWPWFYASVNARMLTGRMRRMHARIFYIAAGLVIIAMAVYLFFQPVTSCPRQ